LYNAQGFWFRSIPLLASVDIDMQARAMMMNGSVIDLALLLDWQATALAGHALVYSL
jgi:hypothetical protein